MSDRRPKSPAASRLSRRGRTPDAAPWNRSVRTGDSGHRPPRPANGRAGRSSSGRRSSGGAPYYALAATPAAVVAAAPSTPLQEPPVELMRQLQDVVVRLSQSAVGEKQHVSHLHQRIDAYAALVREQDRLIDELRGMNMKMQKEMDTLMSFRQQSLNHDLNLMNASEGGAGVDDEICRAFMWHEERAASHGKPHAISSVSPLNSLSPRTRSFVRSLVAQLRDERRKRLEVEEQSSRMIGEQQLTIQRLEDRLRPQNSRGNGPLFGRHDKLSSPAHKDDTSEIWRSAAVEENGASAQKAPATTSTTKFHQYVTGAAAASNGPGNAWTENETKQHLEEVKAITSARSTETSSSVPMAHVMPIDSSLPPKSGSGTKDTSSTTGVDLYSLSTAPDPPLTIHGNTYEDAAAILYNIKKRHGF